MFYFGTNLKMHGTVKRHEAFLASIGENLPAEVEAFVLPPYTSLYALTRSSLPPNLQLGAQNMHWEDEGAYTGAISPIMLKDAGIDLVMLGHAERRNLFGETDSTIHRKVVAAARNDLTILLCVGETMEEKEAGLTRQALTRQLTVALDGLSVPPNLRVAYEPVWAIGEGASEASEEDVIEGMQTVKDVLASLYGGKVVEIPVLFGGSVNAGNCASFATLNVVDGLFVGRAAWQAEGFKEVLQKSLLARSQASP